MPREEQYEGSPYHGMQEHSYGTYDEVSMQQSRHFITALQELKNLRPQLYSAAEYCESSYLYSDQKQVVLDNLKDYSVKALVNAVDHLGTVAFKLNDLLLQHADDISATEMRASTLTQRIRSCQEHSDREGLKQQSLAKSTQANHKHYVLPDVAEISKRVNGQEMVMLRETFDPEQVQAQAKLADGSGNQTPSWQFSSDQSLVQNGSNSSLNRPGSSISRHGASPGPRGNDMPPSSQDTNSSTPPVGMVISERSKSTSRTRPSDRSKSGERSKSVDKSRTGDRSKSSRAHGRSQSTERRPTSKVSSSNGQVPSLDTSGSQLDNVEAERERELRPAPSRSRSLLKSLLSRGRNGPPSCVPSF